MIVMCSGLQRSGKTLFAIYLARKLMEQGYPVYTNMRNVQGFKTIEKIEEVPPNSTLLLDELPNMMDSRDYKNFKNITIWFNTLRKRNIHFIATAINPDMIDLRVRQQIEYLIFAKKDLNNKDILNYRIIDIYSKKFKDFNIYKNLKLFNFANYDTKQIPNIINMDITNWLKENC